MTGGSPQGKPTQSTNRSKREPYHEWASSQIEVEKEGTPEATKGDHHSPTSDDSLSPQRKNQRSDDILQGEFWKIRAPTYEHEVNTWEKDEEWLLWMSKYFQVHNYSSVMQARLSIYNLNGKETRWWRALKHTKKDELWEISWENFQNIFQEKYMSERFFDCKVKDFHELCMGSMTMDAFINIFLDLLHYYHISKKKRRIFNNS